VPGATWSSGSTGGKSANLSRAPSQWAANVDKCIDVLPGDGCKSLFGSFSKKISSFAPADIDGMAGYTPADFVTLIGNVGAPGQGTALRAVEEMREES